MQPIETCILTQKVSDDERGQMYKVEVKASNPSVIWIIYTKKGFGRGGEIHPVNQYVSVVNGLILFLLKHPNGKEEAKLLMQGDSLIIPSGVAHVGLAQTDSVMTEYHSGPLPDFKDKQIYDPYRKLIWGRKDE